MASWHEIDVRIPDARRRKLMEKLSGAGRGGGVPMPGVQSGALGGGGRSFRSASAFRGAPGSQKTHGSNVLASVLARLGIGGPSGGVGEVSPGRGMAIEHIERFLPPNPPVGGANPIPTFGAGGISAPGIPPMNPVGETLASPGMGAAAGPINPTAAPVGGGGYAPSPLGLPDPSQITSGAPTGIVPLGNGLYYDPELDTVMGPGSSAGGSAARRL